MGHVEKVAGGNFLSSSCSERLLHAVGGSVAVFDGFLDVLPLAIVWLILMSSFTWGALQLYVGARLLGPLGICMAWAVYQVPNQDQLPPVFSQLIYSDPLLILCPVSGLRVLLNTSVTLKQNFLLPLSNES